MNENQRALVAVAILVLCFIAWYGSTLYLANGHLEAVSPIAAASATIERLDQIIKLLKEIKHKV